MVISNKIGVVIVSYGHEDLLPGLLGALVDQARAGDKIVVVENHPNRKGAAVARQFKSVAVIEADNKGFSNGCNIGAATIVDDVDVLFFLNPDTKPESNVLEVIRGVDRAKYAAFMPLLVLPDGRVNSAGNVVHMSGLSWCDGYEDSADGYMDVMDVSVLSGACAAITTEWWRKVGGLSEDYFLYYEDTDLSTRILLAGGRMALFPKAHVVHDYDFSKGTHKWLYLERNRPLYIIRNWPLAVIAVLALQLLFIELGLWLVAILQKRFRSKFSATIMFFEALPEAIADRWVIQKTRTISSYDFLRSLVYEFNTPVLGSLGKNTIILSVFKLYYKLSLGVLYLFR